MKLIHSVIFLSVLIVLLPVTPVLGSDWVEYGKTSLGDVYSYNKVKIKHRKNAVQVWVRFVYSDEGRKRYIQGMRKYGGSTEGYDNLSQTLTLYEINCEKGMSRVLSIIEYNNQGVTLYRGSSDKSKWIYIVPGSVKDNLRKKICK